MRRPKCSSSTRSSMKVILFSAAFAIFLVQSTNSVSIREQWRLKQAQGAFVPSTQPAHAASTAGPTFAIPHPLRAAEVDPILLVRGVGAKRKLHAFPPVSWPGTVHNRKMRGVESSEQRPMPSSGVEPVASLHSSSSFSMSGSDASSGEEYSLPLQSKSFQSKHQEKTHVQVTPRTDMPASTSTGTTVHIHPAGETLDAPTGRVIKLNVNADSLLVPKEVGGKRPSYYHAESKRARVASKRINFKKEWNRLKLGTHIPPKDLADKVAAMNVVGLQAVGIGKQAKAVVSTHAWPAYSNAYSARKKMLTTGIDTTKKILANCASSKKMDSKEQHQYLLQETIKRIDRERVAVQPPQSKRVEERREQTAENTAMVAQLVQSRLDTKQLHLSSVPMDQLEAETRDLKIIGMRSRNFTDYLFRHLRANRKTTEEQLNVFRYARGLHHAKVQGVKTKEKAERKRKPENEAEGASASARRVKTKGGAETNRREGEEA